MEQRKFREKGGLLGKLSSGEKKLDGRTFYLDRVKKRSTALLLEAITLFGGKVESFLHKDVSFVVTGCLEDLEPKTPDSTVKTACETTPSKQQQSALKKDGQKQATPRPALTACGSRGKALLEKAMLNNERLQGSSVLTNARSWGVRILYADDVIFYLKQLSRESFDTKSKKSEVYTKQNVNVVKAAPLRSPYLKVEDSSRKYKPLHMQSMNFPSMYFAGHYSPFECPPPPRFDKWTEKEEKKETEKLKAVLSTEDKCGTPLSGNPSPWRPRKKDNAFCECCRQVYNNQEEHLQSDQHRAFVLDLTNYTVVEELLAAMAPGFDPDPPPQPKVLTGDSSPNHHARELEPLTDLETNTAVKELKEASFPNDSVIVISDTVSPACSSPHSEIQPPTTNENLLIPDLCPLSPTMPVLERIPQDPPQLEPYQDFKPLSPGSGNFWLTHDPFPPVLSPQELDRNSHCSYLEAPVLSPQQFLSHEPNKETIFQMYNQANVSQSVPAADSPAESQTDRICFNVRKPRSRSFPRPSTTALNTKKRSRSASPESTSSKRRKTNDVGGFTQTEHGQTPEIASLFFESACKIVQSSPKPVRTLSSFECGDYTQAFGAFTAPEMLSVWPLSVKACPNPSQNSDRSNSHSTSVCIESALIPDVAALSSSDSDWDCELLSRLGAPSVSARTPVEAAGELDQDVLHRPCTWMHDSSYENRLHRILQPSAQPITDSTAFCRTVVQIVEVQH